GTAIVQMMDVAPSIVPTTDPFEIHEGQTVTIANLGTFTDPGITDPTAGTVESFTALIDWKDGSSPEALTLTWSTAADGSKTLGNLGGASHFYADNDRDGVLDNIYNVTIALAEDDTGQVIGIFQVRVLNFNPTPQPIFASDVSPQGVTELHLV